ncbi:MAG: type IV-A pilus assembly ATPase PilB [Deltaproteobacteria bacterium]|nr:type IV-A pilus assembly ATPase PilB [Deltaproteobacteria bacterium]MCL5277969.1 type IV-A pilus assembly ATPase PilB [Deltaproteobacteria bacterium]
MTSRLGELLVKENLITTDQLKKAIEEQKAEGGRLGSSLTKLGFVTDEELLTFLSKQYNVPVINLDEFDIDKEIARKIPENIAKKHLVIPVNQTGATLIVATSDPTNLAVIDEIKFLTGYNVEFVAATEGALKKAIEKFFEISTDYQGILDEAAEEYEVIGEEDNIDIKSLEKASEEAPVIKLVNSILNDAIKRGASDIHVEPYEKSFRVRFRIDGMLYEIMKPPVSLKNAISSRLKIMAKLDIAERRRPQDGRIKIRYADGKDIDFRVSVLPTLFGEKIVLRLLDKSNLQLDMTKLGFNEKQLKDFKDAVHKPYGMVLVTGPTGSGKTTTLYSALSELNQISKNVSTAEDPVEYNIPGVNQVQMHEEIGLNFAAALRSFLRQDPNIIMVGEIRDYETAEIAVKAALTGHLVLSTIHTNDAPSTINRLLNMGIEPFLVASSVHAILAQRLVRKTCEKCKEEIDIEKKALLDIGISESEVAKIKVYKGKGCTTCNNTGYKGRIAVYEILTIGEEIRELILAGASANEIKKEAMRVGMMTMRQSSIELLRKGLTTVDEVVRVTAKD